MTRGRPDGPATQLIGALLAARCDHGRLVRGLELHELGRVRDLDLEPRAAAAHIAGSGATPYEATLALRRPGRPDAPDALRFDCTCPDWGDPCKHGVALAFAVAARLDEDPELAASWWGGGPASAPAASGRTGEPVPLPTERPAWAEPLASPPPPTSIDAFLGVAGRVRIVAPPLRDLEAGVLDELGPLLVAAGADLAPGVRALLEQLVRAARS